MRSDCFPSCSLFFSFLLMLIDVVVIVLLLPLSMNGEMKQFTFQREVEASMRVTRAE